VDRDLRAWDAWRCGFLEQYTLDAGLYGEEGNVGLEPWLFFGGMVVCVRGCCVPAANSRIEIRIQFDAPRGLSMVRYIGYVKALLHALIHVGVPHTFVASNFRRRTISLVDLALITFSWPSPAINKHSLDNRSKPSVLSKGF
jgi:hypothetical protein